MSHRSIASPVTSILIGIFLAILVFFAFRVLELDQKIKNTFNKYRGFSIGEIIKKPNIKIPDFPELPQLPEINIPDINLPNFNNSQTPTPSTNSSEEVAVEVIETEGLSEEEFLDDGPLLTSAYAYLVTSPSVTACEFDLTPKKVTFDPTSRVIRATLTKMFELGISTGIENPALGKGFSVYDITIKGDLAIIELTSSSTLADYCEKKKFKAQVNSVAKQFPNVKSTEVLLNGIKL